MRPKRSRSSVRLVAFWAAIVAVVCVPREAAPGDVDDAPLARRAGITLIVNTPMRFGTLADKDGYVEIGPNDDLIANPDHLIVEPTFYSGVIDIDGDPDTAVTISIAGGSDNGLTISNFHTDRGDPPLTGVSLGPTGTIQLYLGARLAVSSLSASPGTGLSVPFTITVQYE